MRKKEGAWRVGPGGRTGAPHGPPADRRASGRGRGRTRGGSEARGAPRARGRAPDSRRPPPLFFLSEAFADWLPPFGVPLTYAIAIGYVLVDTVDKGVKAKQRADAELSDVRRPDVDTATLAWLLAGERTLDTITWQLLASVFVPGFTIHTVVAAFHAGLLQLEALPAVRDAVGAIGAAVGASPDAAMAVADKSLPTAVGLAAIPFIVHPIDNAIHALLNVTLRPALKSYVCGAAGKGKEAGLELCADCGPWKRPKEGAAKKH